MDLDVSIDSNSVSINIDNPFQLDTASIMNKIDAFLSSNSDSIKGVDISGLLPRLVKGVAGCEHGCPADAKGLVSRGFKDFEIEYIEGGILSAKTRTRNGKDLYLKLFPDF